MELHFPLTLYIAYNIAYYMIKHIRFNMLMRNIRILQHIFKISMLAEFELSWY